MSKNPVSDILGMLAADPHIAPALTRAFEKAGPRRFNAEPVTAFAQLTDPCPECGGSGDGPESDYCVTCNGSGRVDVEGDCT